MDINSREFLEKLTSVKPSQRQIDWQEMGYYNFVHFGTNTFTNREWGDGKADPKVFNPTKLDTDQWVRAFRDSGSKGVIITAKHHDGFCLFPSKYTDYTVASSPYKDGKGDIVGEMAESCRKYGLKFGIYLSPWDRHEKTYGTDEYNDFYCKQLTEICTNYGELFCLWFDGACGEGENGKKQVYDLDRYYSIIRELQPNAVISIIGPDVRWVGNEAGTCRAEEWSVVSGIHNDYTRTKDLYQQDEKNPPYPNASAEWKDLGSREILANQKELIWYPAEMDVPITKWHWFWHRYSETFLTLKLKDLVKIYNTSVGANATFLLNVAPNRQGLLPKKHVKLLKAFGDEIKRRYGRPIKVECEQIGEIEYEFKFDKQRVCAMMIAEDVNYSQRIEQVELYAKVGDGYKQIYEAKTVGFKKICLFKAVNTDSIKLVVKKCRLEPHLHKVEVYNW